MQKPEIDNSTILELADDFQKFIDVLQDDIRILRDENADIFKRFMTYFKIGAFIKSTIDIKQHIDNAICAGHMLNHPVLQTEESKEAGWDEINLHYSPFFIDKEKEAKEKILKEKIGEALVNAIKKR